MKRNPDAVQTPRPNPWTPGQHSFLLCPRTHILMCECPCCRAHAEREVARHNARVQAATPLFPGAFPEMLWTVEGRMASQYRYWRKLERAIYGRDPDETEALIRAAANQADLRSAETSDGAGGERS